MISALGTVAFVLMKSNDETQIMNRFIEIVRTHKGISNTVNYYRCYEHYFNDPIYIGNTVQSYYFGFKFMPRYYKRVVKKFNRTFKNLQIVPILDSNIRAEDVINFYSGNSMEIGNCLKVFKLKPDDFNPVNYDPLTDADFKFFRSALFRLDYSDAYTDKSRKYLGYIIHHFMRMLSVGEGFLKEHAPVSFDKDLCSIDFILELNNRSKASRALSEHEILKKDFLKLDNIELINLKSANLQQWSRQTAILDTLVRG